MDLACNIRFNISRSTLIKSLFDYYYNLCGGFSNEEKTEKDLSYKKELDKLSKRGCINIVKDQLKHYGYQGSYHDGFFESATDVADQRLLWEENCIEYVNKTTLI
jgi:hypothetical protein